MKPDYMHYDSQTSTRKYLEDAGVLYPQTYPTGWVCPKCGRVYSPITPCCFHCGDEGNCKVTNSTSGTISLEKDEVIE